MNKIDKNKLVLPTAIVLGCLILGGAFYAIQLNKQKSIEKQQQIEIQGKSEAESIKKANLSICLDKVNTDYYDFWGISENKNKQTAINNCYKQY